MLQFSFESWFWYGVRACFIVHNVVMGLWLSMLFGFHIYLISSNLTSNEAANWKRFHYLKDARGHYYNRYSRGILKNFVAFITNSTGIRTSDRELRSILVDTNEDEIGLMESKFSGLEALSMQRIDQIRRHLGEIK